MNAEKVVAAMQEEVDRLDFVRVNLAAAISIRLADNDGAVYVGNLQNMLSDATERQAVLEYWLGKGKS